MRRAVKRGGCTGRLHRAVAQGGYTGRLELDRVVAFVGCRVVDADFGKWIVPHTR